MCMYATTSSSFSLHSLILSRLSSLFLLSYFFSLHSSLFFLHPYFFILPSFFFFLISSSLFYKIFVSYVHIHNQRHNQTKSSRILVGHICTSHPFCLSIFYQNFFLLYISQSILSLNQLSDLRVLIINKFMLVL
jgi:hypothetical protein